MRKTQTTAISGCLIWFFLISIISTCVMPVFMMAGSLTSFTDFAINTTGGWICPEGTTPQRNSYQTTIRDDGFDRPATAYELQCVDASGEVVMTDPVGYAFLWIGIFVAVGFVISVALSFVFAVPGGMLVTKLLERLRGKPASSHA